MKDAELEQTCRAQKDYEKRYEPLLLVVQGEWLDMLMTRIFRDKSALRNQISSALVAFLPGTARVEDWQG